MPGTRGSGWAGDLDGDTGPSWTTRASKQCSRGGGFPVPPATVMQGWPIPQLPPATPSQLVACVRPLVHFSGGPASGPRRQVGPTCGSRVPGRLCVPPPAGTSWAVFDEPANSPVPAPGVAVDVGSGVWAAGTQSPSTWEEKGWATFTDFQPFCW